AAGTSPAAAWRYHSTALVESRSTPRPRSYRTPVVKAAVGEPASAARRYQPAPDDASRGTPLPDSSRRPSSSIAATSLVCARWRTSSIGIADHAASFGLSDAAIETGTAFWAGADAAPNRAAISRAGRRKRRAG